VRILIIDDHEVVRQGIGLIISGIQPDAHIGYAGSCAEGIAAARGSEWDLVLLDLHLPDQPGFVALEQFRRDLPDLPVVIVSGQEDQMTVLKALDLGAKAFLPKSAQSARIRAALETLLAGQVYLPDSVLDAGSGGKGAARPPIKAEKLTDRQREVLRLVVEGYSNKLIARKLDIAESTVKIHVSAIFRELKVASRTQAIVEVARSGIPLH